MKFYVKFAQKWFPKKYAKLKLRQAEKLHFQQRKNATSKERAELEFHQYEEIREWTDWIGEIEDTELVAKAAKMDIHLDDMPLPHSEGEERQSHYEIGRFGDQLLKQETRTSLRTRIRERGPTFRKERRENIELWVKILTAVTGLGGVVIGMIALLQKW